MPGHAEICIDIRTVPGCLHATLADDLARHLGEEATLSSIVDVAPVWTDPEDSWVRRLGEIAAEVTGETRGLGAATFFTDASVLAAGLGGVPAASAPASPGWPTRPTNTASFAESRKRSRYSAGRSSTGAASDGAG